MNDFQDSYKNTKKCESCGIKVTRNARSFHYCEQCAYQIKLKKHRKADKKYADKNRPTIRIKNRLWNRTESAKISYKKYRSTEKYREYSRQRYLLEKPNKKKAGYYVHNALRSGKLKRPEYCEECGIKDWGKERSMIEGHHYKGYEPENWFNIKWLCTNCHKRADNFIKEG